MTFIDIETFEADNLVDLKQSIKQFFASHSEIPRQDYLKIYFNSVPVNSGRGITYIQHHAFIVYEDKATEDFANDNNDDDNNVIKNLNYEEMEE